MKKVFVSVALQAIFSCFHTPVAAQTVSLGEIICVTDSKDSVQVVDFTAQKVKLIELHLEVLSPILCDPYASAYLKYDVMDKNVNRAIPAREEEIESNNE